MKKHAICSANDMAWPANHANDCYFCLTKVFEYSKRTKSRIVYPHCPSALCSVIHSHENVSLPTPLPASERDNDSPSCPSDVLQISAESIEFSQTSKSSAGITSMLSDEELHSSQEVDIPELLNPNDLNDLLRD